MRRNQSNLLLIGLGLLCLMLLISALIPNRRIQEHFEDTEKDTEIGEIPKTIWTFWDTDELPDLVEACIDTWKKANPSYTINILNKKNLEEYIKDGDTLIDLPRSQDFVARLSDFVRIHVLAEHGGVWIDATTICVRPLEDILEDDDDSDGPYEFIGYFMPNFTTQEKWPVIENWFMAAPKNSAFLREWRDEFMKSNDYVHVEEYLEDLRDRNVDLQKLAMPEYLTMHAAAQAVLQQGSALHKEYRIKVREANGADGPFRYLNETGWESDLALKAICNGKYITPLIKLRGTERKAIEESDIDFLSCIQKIIA